jgi:hypothetical protein
MLADPGPEQAHAKVTIRALCPKCGRLALHESLHRTGTIRTATYLCPRDHGWLVKWADDGRPT